MILVCVEGDEPHLTLLYNEVVSGHRVTGTIKSTESFLMYVTILKIQDNYNK